MNPWYTFFSDTNLNQIYTDYTIVCNAVILPILGAVGRWFYRRSKKGADDVGAGT